MKVMSRNELQLLDMNIYATCIFFLSNFWVLIDTLQHCLTLVLYNPNKTVSITNYGLFCWIVEESYERGSITFVVIMDFFLGQMMNPIYEILLITVFVTKYLIFSDINECSSNPCQNSGICVDEIGDYQCTCSTGFTGKSCEISEYHLIYWWYFLMNLYYSTTF